MLSIIFRGKIFKELVMEKKGIDKNLMTIIIVAIIVGGDIICTAINGFVVKSEMSRIEKDSAQVQKQLNDAYADLQKATKDLEKELENLDLDFDFE